MKKVYQKFNGDIYTTFLELKKTIDKKITNYYCY